MTQENKVIVTEETIEEENEKDKKEKNNALAKETSKEFLRSLLIGWIPVGLDYIFTALVFFIFALNAMGYTFFQTFNIDRDVISSGILALGTAIGYLMGFIAAYLFSVFFVFKHNKKSKTLKGTLIFIGVEVLAYGLNIGLGILLGKVMAYTFAFIVRICLSYIVVFLMRKFLIFMPEIKK